MPADEQPAGGVIVPPDDPAEENRAHVSEDVVATYVAAAVRSIPGVSELHGKPWQELSERVHMNTARKGVVIKEVAPGVVEVEVHVSVAWGTVIPEMAQRLQESVAHSVETLLDLQVRKTTVYVDEVEAPLELR
ncbi:MAG TPA: Asp23/Gls24 family envelope stress response protein [Thermoleophilia bacterium]|nr:Asp23/Gls24 family envelope stress response protein [Thermoleophilia bacterium]